MKLKNVKKAVDESMQTKNEVLALDDKGISKLTDITDDFGRLSHLTSLILAHNKLTNLTQGKTFFDWKFGNFTFSRHGKHINFLAIASMQNLEVLNCFNNQISELPSNINAVSNYTFFWRAEKLALLFFLKNPTF